MWEANAPSTACPASSLWHISCHDHSRENEGRLRPGIGRQTARTPRASRQEPVVLRWECSNQKVPFHGRACTFQRAATLAAAGTDKRPATHAPGRVNRAQTITSAACRPVRRSMYSCALSTRFGGTNVFGQIVPEGWQPARRAPLVLVCYTTT